MNAGPLRHVVFFQFSDDATAEDVEDVVAAFLRLGEAIPEVREIEWGLDCGVEGQSEGLTHAFQLTFEDTPARDRYLVHSEHQRFSEYARTLLARVIGLDYVARRLIGPN